MSLDIIPLERLTRGHEIFKCEPLNCTMFARRCVERQAQADSDYPPAALTICKACSLGRQVKERVGGDVQLAPGAATRHMMHRPKGQRPKALRTKEFTASATAFREGQRTPDQLPQTDIVPESTAAVAPARAIAAAINARSDLPYTAKVTGPFADADPPSPAIADEQQQNEGTMARKKIRKSMLELAGKTVAGVKVTGRNEKTGEWDYKHPKCGHTGSAPGGQLMAYERKGYTRPCQECPKEDRAAAKPERKARVAAPARAAVSAPPQRRRVAASDTDARSYDFPLRPDFLTTVSLPADLSSADVERLQAWLETLVFEDA